MRSFYEPYEPDEGDLDSDPVLGPLDALEVEVTENPVVGQLLDVDGDVLLEIRERAVVPFGFRGTQ